MSLLVEGDRRDEGPSCPPVALRRPKQGPKQPIPKDIQRGSYVNQITSITFGTGQACCSYVDVLKIYITAWTRVVLRAD